MTVSTIEDYHAALHGARTKTLQEAAVEVASAVADKKAVPVEALATFTAARSLLHPTASEDLS